MRAISKYKPPEAYIWRGDLKEGFWRGLFSEFYGITNVTPFIKSTVYVSYIVPSTEPRFLYGEGGGRGGVRVRLFEGGANSIRALIGSWELIRAFFTVVYAQTWERLILKNPIEPP